MCLVDVSILLSTTMFDNCVPRRQLDGCSVTRPFLSAKGVACETRNEASCTWHVRLLDKLVVISKSQASQARPTEGWTNCAYKCVPSYHKVQSDYVVA